MSGCIIIGYGMAKAMHIDGAGMICGIADRQSLCVSSADRHRLCTNMQTRSLIERI